MCDSGERYAGSYYDAGWLARQGLEPAGYEQMLDNFLDTGTWNG
jgi:cysteine synthase A